MTSSSGLWGPISSSYLTLVNVLVGVIVTSSSGLWSPVSFTHPSLSLLASVIVTSSSGSWGPVSVAHLQLSSSCTFCTPSMVVTAVSICTRKKWHITHTVCWSPLHAHYNINTASTIHWIQYVFWSPPYPTNYQYHGIIDGTIGCMYSLHSIRWNAMHSLQVRCIFTPFMCDVHLIAGAYRDSSGLEPSRFLAASRWISACLVRSRHFRLFAVYGVYGIN